MDITKIGKYIAGKRKLCGLTQRELAEKLGMSDKSVSKWERGICLPDVSVYTELCDILEISLNEFIAGEDIPEHNVVRQSEDNLIQVTVDGKWRRDKLHRIIAALVCFTVVVTALLGCVMYKSRTGKQDYVEPIAKESPQMKMATMLSGVDGAHLYQYSVSEKYEKMQLNLTTYKQGKKMSKATAASVRFHEGELREGLIAVIPDFEQYKVNVIIADNSTKFSIDFDILEGVSGREYYGRTASEPGEQQDIYDGKELGVLALIYGEKTVSAQPVADIQKGEVNPDNDYVYCLSLEFAK